MDDEAARQIRRVRGFLVASGVFAGLFCLAAFKQSQMRRFAEIDVERINVI